MAANATTLTEKMRAALRISSTSEKITEEINDCIAACKADLANDGVKRIDEKDGLIIRAVTLYCKAEFGYNNNAEKFRNSYDTLKMRLSMSNEYNTPEVSETDTEEQPQDSWGVLEWVRYTLCCLMEKAGDVSEDNLYKLQEILVESDGQVKGQMNIKDFPEALPESGAEHE